MSSRYLICCQAVFVERFRDGYYCDKESIEEAVKTRGMFNIEDIKNLKVIEKLDWTYIREWIGKLKLNTFDLL